MDGFDLSSILRRTNQSPFDEIRQVDVDPVRGEFEWWSARAAMPFLGYATWQNMQSVINRAKTACRNCGAHVASHFTDTSKTPPQGGPRQADTQLTRFGMYLVAMNGEPSKPEIAHAQRYFAIQTYRAEQLLPATPTVQVTTAAAMQKPEIRPWAARFQETFAAHLQYVRRTFPAGSFSVVTAGLTEYYVMEDQLLRHMMELKSSDRPDISIGKRWAKSRRERGLHDVSDFAPLFLPDQFKEVGLFVYPGTERTQFDIWFQSTYFTSHYFEYVNGKKEWKKYGQLSRASVADQTCLTLTGHEAAIPTQTRLKLSAAGGFVPAAAIPGKQSSNTAIG